MEDWVPFSPFQLVFTNSIYTISVGSAASNGQQSYFDEMCSAKMVVTFDSDPYEDERHVRL